jgi:hypothetical protein
MPKEARRTLQNRQEVMPVHQHQEKPILQTHREEIKETYGYSPKLTSLTLPL